MGTIYHVDPDGQRLPVIAPGVAPNAVRSMPWDLLRVTHESREGGRLLDLPDAFP